MVNERPEEGTEISLPVTVAADGATSQDTGDGSVELVGDNGVVARVGSPAMWDAAADGQLANPLTLEWEMSTQQSLWALAETKNTPPKDEGFDADDSPSAQEPDDEPREVGVTVPVPVPTSVNVSEESAQVLLQPAEDFLQSEGVDYPLIVDPSVSIGVAFDAFVQSGVTGDFSSDPELRLGTFDGGNTVARSFLGFTTSAAKGVKVTSAQINLWEFWSYSCNARQWDLWSVSAASSATRWTKQPTWFQKYSSSTATKGYSSSCGAGWVSIDATSWAQAASNNGDATNWVGIRAANESDTFGWKRFNSGDAVSGRPTLSITYNSYPATPGYTTIPRGQYNWWTDGSGNRSLYANSARPSFSALVKDPDRGQVKGRFSVLQGSTTVWDRPSAPRSPREGHQPSIRPRRSRH